MANILPNDKPGFLVISAKPCSGKSHLIKYLMLLNHPDFTHNDFKYGIVFTSTSFNRDYESYIPNEFIHSQYNPDVLQNLMTLQENQIRSNGSAQRAFIIFDDCLPMKAFGTQLWLNLCTQYRHYGLTVILSSQYIFRVPAVTREIASNAIFFKQTTRRSAEALYETYGGNFNNLKQFSDYLNKLEQYQFVSYNPNSPETELSKLYPVLRCPANIPEFRYEF